MSPIRIFVAAVAVAGVLAGTGAGAAAAAAVSRFDDGSFETPTVGDNTFVNLGTGASIGPWKVTRPARSSSAKPHVRRGQDR